MENNKEFVALHPRGRPETEAAGCYSLGTSLRELHEKYESRKKEIRFLLEETEALRKKAVVFLKKANCLTRRLTARQRRETGVFYHPSFFDSCIRGKENRRLIPNRILGSEEPELSELSRSPDFGLGELRMLHLMDMLKKKLLALDLLEMRCRELLLSMDKALEAFKHEYALIRRRLYPYSLFSAFRKSLRPLGGLPYFSPRDLKELVVLGDLTGHVLKIADSPIL